MSKGKRTVRTPKKSKLFLNGLRKTGVISYACEMAKIGRTAAYAWRADDAEFAKAWNEALDEALDALELEARRRAHDGLIKKKFHEGAAIIDPATGEQYYEREYSDTLMIFLLKGGRPEKYRDQFDVNLRKLSDEDLIAAAKGILAGDDASGSDAPTSGNK